MDKKSSFMPADFYEEFEDNNRRSRFNSKKLKKMNKIQWEEEFNLLLDFEELKLLEGIKRVHANNVGIKVLLQDEIKRAFSNSNPHELTLKFCYNMNESLDKKSALTLTLLEMLCMVVDPVISSDLKTYAFNYFSQTTRSGIVMAIRAFRLMDSSEMFHHKVLKIAQHPWTCQAAIVAIELNLCDKVPIELTLIPLFMKNNHDIYFEYMDKSETARMMMIKFLDSLMESDDAYGCYLIKNEISGIETKTRKMIKNHIFKLRDRYQLDESDTPATTHYHYTKYIRYIMYEYYDCERITKEIYEDKVKEIADKDVELQKFLVQFSCDRGFGNDAAKWKNYYNLDVNISHYDLTNYEKATTDKTNDTYYTLPNDVTKIFVDSEKLFEEMLATLHSQQFVGLDCEQQVTNDLSLIQIGTKKVIFIVDAMAMRTKFNWEKLNDKLFSNYRIKKLGCGIILDIKTIEKFLGIKIERDASYVDLGKLGEKLMNVEKFKFPFEDTDENNARQPQQTNTPGLSRMTKLCLGKGLNKACAISNWTMRPLREEQLIYAAIDAFCAIEIFEKINEILGKLNLHYEDVYYAVEGKKK